MIDSQVLATMNALKQILAQLENAHQRPHGPQAPPDEAKVAGDACIVLCDGDQNRARSLWKLITADLDGYMPHAAAVAVIRASNTTNLVPDIEGPEVK